LTVTEQPATDPGIDPRLRARRIAVRREEGRKRLQRLGILGVVAVVAALAVAVTRSPFLDVDRIPVTGATHTPPEAVQQATAIRRHEPMTDVDLDAARRGVLALPWIRTVSVARKWPSTVEVVISERIPVAAVTAGSLGFVLVDGDGRVLEASPGPPPGFLLLANVPTPGPPGTSLDPSASNALAVARAMSESLRAKVSTIAVDGDGVSLRLIAGGVVQLGAATEVTAKLRAADTVLTSLDNARVCVIDVRVPSAPS
jgi:cell division protein FtsQ